MVVIGIFHRVYLPVPYYRLTRFSLHCKQPKCNTSSCQPYTNLSTLPERTYRGPKLPELQRDHLRLINMRFCPYAQRTRLVLEHKKIPYETYNVDLSKKPDWFLKLNPIGLVPVLQRNDEVIIESLICNDWLETHYPTPKGIELAASSVAESFRWRCMTAQVESRVIPKFYGYLKTQMMPDSEAAAKKSVFLKGMSWLEDELGDQAYFADDKVGLIDFNIYPWIERMADLETWDCPRLLAWRARMQQLPGVKQSTMFNFSNHRKFHQQYMRARVDGTTIDYDFDLEE